jgi:hypothetical protein
MGVWPLGAGLVVSGLVPRSKEKEVSTSGHWQSPKMVKQNSSDVLVPMVIWRRSWARIGPSSPIAPALGIVSDP